MCVTTPYIRSSTLSTSREASTEVVLRRQTRGKSTPYPIPQDDAEQGVLSIDLEMESTDRRKISLHAGQPVLFPQRFSSPARNVTVRIAKRPQLNYLWSIKSPLSAFCKERARRLDCKLNDAPGSPARNWPMEGCDSAWVVDQGGPDWALTNPHAPTGGRRQAQTVQPPSVILCPSFCPPRASLNQSLVPDAHPCAHPSRARWHLPCPEACIPESQCGQSSRLGHRQGSWELACLRWHLASPVCSPPSTLNPFLCRHGSATPEIAFPLYEAVVGLIIGF